MKHLNGFNELNGRSLKEVLDEAMVEIYDNFDITVFDEGNSLKSFEVGNVVISIYFENIDSKGEFSLKGDSYMGSNYPSIDTGIEYADIYAAFLKSMKRVMTKLELEGFKTKLRADSIRSFKLSIHKPRKPDWVD